MFLKIAIMNNSGNVGKSMVCDTFLKPRIEGAESIKIETINSDGSNDETISAKNFKAVFERIDSTDTAIIDVGSSNIETFMKNLSRLPDAHQDIDLFLIPTSPKPKQQADTIATIHSLLGLGVNKERIKLIFNFYDVEFSPQQLYPIIFENEIAKMLELDDFQNITTIPDNPVFDMLGEIGISFTEIANDKRDFKALIRGTEDREERALLSHQRSAQRLARGFIKELDTAFDKIQGAFDVAVAE